jgi:hypothetical protein
VAELISYGSPCIQGVQEGYDVAKYPRDSKINASIKISGYQLISFSFLLEKKKKTKTKTKTRALSPKLLFRVPQAGETGGR